MFFLFSTNIQSQTTWTGAIDSDWNNPGNWSAGVPMATDDVIITDVVNHPVIASADVVAKTVSINTDGTLVINSGGVLTLNGTGPHSLLNEGTVNNNGTITIGNSGTAGYYGINNSRIFNNNGFINIDNTQTGFYSVSAISSLINSGEINIGANASVGNFGLQTNRIVTNNTSGVINIDRCTISGFLAMSSSSTALITNSGQINIGANASVGNNGLANHGNFTNNADGEINIDRSNHTGLYLEGTSATSSFTNYGHVNIGSIASVGNYGIQNSLNLINNSSGIINIDRSTQQGIVNYPLGTCTNSGTLNIGAIVGVGADGLWNRGLFNNNTQGFINIDNSVWGLYQSTTNAIFNNAGILNFGNLGSPGLVGIDNSAGTMNNNIGGLIKIDSSTLAAVYNNGTFNNHSTITIGSIAISGQFGIQNNKTFSNSATGSINIDNISSAAIKNIVNQSFTNAGQISLGISNNIGQIGIENEGLFENSTNGSIAIERWTTSAIKNISGFFNNFSFIDISQANIGGQNGIENLATFNHQGGNIFLDRCSNYGIKNSSGVFNNSAPLSIGNIGNIGVNGIQNEAIFNHLSDEIGITNCSNAAINNSFGGTFSNQADLNIGNIDINNYGIINAGTFSNDLSGNILIDNTTYSGVHSADGVFSNNALLTIGEFIGTNLIDGTGGIFENNTPSTLKGSGNILPTYFSNSGGTLSPGYSPGILTFSSGEDFTNSRFDIEVDGITNPGQDFDQIVVNGVATIGAGTNLNFTFSYEFIEDMSFDILTATSINGTIPLSNISFNNIGAGNVAGIIISYVTINGVEAIRVTASSVIPTFAPFITTWKTDNPGSSNSTSITIPTTGTGYNYDVDWNNDGIFDDLNVTGSITHDYGTAGTYQVAIRGYFPRIYFEGLGDRLKILSIDQWGDIAWTSMEESFYGCENLDYNATDVPDLSGVFSLKSMFSECTNFNGNIGSWDLNNITTMDYMFSLAQSFNQDISNWDVSNVTTFELVFEGATSFNQNISSWDVNNATSLYGMFRNATAFNQDISNWDVGNVINIGEMFEGAIAFNNDISNWDVSNVISMGLMFRFATSFNQNLGNWNLSSNMDMYSLENMFDNSGMDCNNYSATLIGWSNNPNTPDDLQLGAINMKYTINAQNARDNLISNKGWTIVGDAPCTGNVPFITTWVTDNGQIIIPTLGTGYNYNIQWFNESNPGIGDGTASSVGGSFLIASLQNGSTYRVEITGDFPRIYFNNTGDKLKIKSIEQWGDIGWTSMERAFWGCTNLIGNATDNPDLSSVTSLALMFAECQNFNGDISGWNTQNVTLMHNMFRGATSFNQDIGNWNTSNVISFIQMFWNANAFNQDIGGWNTQSAISMVAMFRNTTAFNQDISSWEVGNVTNMSLMFSGATNFNQPLNSWNTSNVTNMSFMFHTAFAFNQLIADWNTENVTNMNSMFWQAENFNQPIGIWNTVNVTNMFEMFKYSFSFNHNLGDWEISNVTNMADMLSLSGISSDNYDFTLIGWASQTVQPNVNLGATGMLYCNAKIAREQLIEDLGWNIVGDAELPTCFYPFITTWKTDNPGSSNSTSITIPTTGTGYNYDVDWNNDGIFDDLNVTGSITHDYGTAGTYQIAIRGDFPRIYFFNTGDKQKIISIDQWGDIEWSSMQFAFNGCNNLVYNASDNPVLSNVSNTQNMFAGCTLFNGNIAAWNTQNVTNMSGMFSGASQFNQNIGSWQTQNVTNLSGMFSGASQFNQDIGSWQTQNVTNMTGVFSGATQFNRDLSMWNTQNVTTISNMFSGASSFNQDISMWNTQNVTNMNGTFVNAPSFNRSLGNWNIQNVTTMSNMLNNSGLSLNNYDNTLIGWASQTVNTNVSLGAQGRQYCSGQTARNTLVNINGWIITGDGLNCPPTCTDGIQNGDETGIDCGGSTCPPCNTFYADNDNDSYGDLNITIQAHIAPIGYVPIAGDCDDNDPEVYQGSVIVKSNSVNNLWSDTNHWLCDMPSNNTDIVIINTNTIFDVAAATLPSSLTVANGILTIPAGNILTLGSVSNPVNAVVEVGGTLHVEGGGTLIVYGILNQASGMILNEGNIEVR
jgi:surface protein